MVIDVGRPRPGTPPTPRPRSSRCAAVPDAVLKVIIESAALTDDEVVAACRAAEAAGADFVKTSTASTRRAGRPSTRVRLRWPPRWAGDWASRRPAASATGPPRRRWSRPAPPGWPVGHPRRPRGTTGRRGVRLLSPGPRRPRAPPRAPPPGRAPRTEGGGAARPGPHSGWSRCAPGRPVMPWTTTSTRRDVRQVADHVLERSALTTCRPETCPDQVMITSSKPLLIAVHHPKSIVSISARTTASTKPRGWRA